MVRSVAILLISMLLPAALCAYPLDGAQETGIERLEGYRLAQQGKVPGNKLWKGARMPTDKVRLRLTHLPDYELPASDRKLSGEIIRLLGEDAANYSISLLDLSDPEAPRYAEHQAQMTRNPGSVGKMVVVLAIFQALADIYPDDIEAREELLRNSQLVADRFIRTDHHKVPFWRPEKMRLIKRPVAQGDAANFWTWLDWMMSASSNAAASTVIEHLLLLRHFGRAYPVSRQMQDEYLTETPKKELSKALIAALQEPLGRNGLDREKLRQGGFFTWMGKRLIPGSNSVCTTRELMRYLLLLEQGKLVDEWSSLQIKRLMYMTQHRIRYASSPALGDAAVYFKSGSLYKCRPEEGFVCKKYHGNVTNMLNSVAIVEWPAGAPQLNYMVTITSNVLRKNSAVEHQTLATRIQRLMQRLHPEPKAAE